MMLAWLSNLSISLIFHLAQQAAQPTVPTAALHRPKFSPLPPGGPIKS
jgi:hypothetical protein